MNKLHKAVITATECVDSFRGIARVLEMKESEGAFSVLFDFHGKKVRVLKRRDGVLFVNCSGHTALISRSLQRLRSEVVQVLRGAA